MNPGATPERRRHSRSPVKLRAVGLFARPFLRRELSVLDVSPAGARVQAKDGRGIVLGACCTIKIRRAGLTEAFTIDAVVVNIAGPNRFGLEVSSPDAIRELRDALNIEFAPDDLGTDDPTAVGFAPS